MLEEDRTGRTRTAALPSALLQAVAPRKVENAIAVVRNPEVAVSDAFELFEGVFAGSAVEDHAAAGGAEGAVEFGFGGGAEGAGDGGGVEGDGFAGGCCFDWIPACAGMTVFGGMTGGDDYAVVFEGGPAGFGDAIDGPRGMVGEVDGDIGHAFEVLEAGADVAFDHGEGRAADEGGEDGDGEVGGVGGVGGDFYAFDEAEIDNADGHFGVVDGVEDGFDVILGEHGGGVDHHLLTRVAR